MQVNIFYGLITLTFMIYVDEWPRIVSQEHEDEFIIYNSLSVRQSGYEKGKSKYSVSFRRENRL